jgi:hypothetical protein
MFTVYVLICEFSVNSLIFHIPAHVGTFVFYTAIPYSVDTVNRFN